MSADGVRITIRQRRAQRAGCVANAFEAREGVRVTIDMRLRDRPIVGARVARFAGVGEDDALFELERVDWQRDTMDAVDTKFDR